MNQKESVEVQFQQEEHPESSNDAEKIEQVEEISIDEEVDVAGQREIFNVFSTVKI